MIKIEHTLFALPIVISALFLAWQNISNINLKPVLWILVCFISARASGMTLNRLIDWRIDALNPRTSGREIPSKQISPQLALIYAILSLGLLTYSSFQLPNICQKLLPIAIGFLFIYSWLKRFTCLSHFVLGLILGGAALGAWIAVREQIDSMGIIYFSLAISLWVAGFDILYSLQDFDFDHKQGLHSIPAIFGKSNAISIARLSHIIMIGLLYLTGLTLGLGLIYHSGLAIISLALIYEHSLVQQDQIDKAFFDLNVWIGFLIMISVVADFFIHV